MQKKFKKSEIRAKLKKLENLAYSRPQEEILIGLDEILQTNPDDIDTLNFKADMLNQLGKKEESCEISQRVLELDASNAEANINIGLIKLDICKLIIGFLKDKSEQFVLLINLCVIFISIVGGICLSFYTNPQYESISCDSQYKCVVEHIFYKNYKKAETLQFSKNTKYTPIIKEHFKQRKSSVKKDGYTYNHAFSENGQNYDIFKYSFHKYYEDEMESMKEKESQRFENYKKNPNQQYNLHIDEQVNRISDISYAIVSLIFAQYLMILLLLYLYSKFICGKKKEL